VEALRRRGARALLDATRPGVLAQARLGAARLVAVAAPDPYRAREIVKLARRANPSIDMVARSHGAAEPT
jgi:CPA2 family monovalent cation:H+ antiporter-2